MADNYCIDGHKLLWHLDRVLEWQEHKVIPPIYIEVSPISLCNHRCAFCGIDFAREKGLKLDTEILCRCLEEMGKIGVRSVMFAGEGEPLLHKDLSVIVKAAKDANIDVAITTNGTLGSYGLWKEVLPHLTWLRFSLDAGSQEVYSKVHGVPEAFFQQTINSIKEAVMVRKDNSLDLTIGAQFLILEENLGDIEKSIELCSELKLDYFSLKPYSFNPKMIKKRYELYTEETVRYVQQIVEKYSKGNLNIIYRKDAIENYMEGRKDFNSCKALPFGGYLSSDGSFYTCKEFIGDERFKTGNIYKEDLSSILLGQRRLESIEYAEKELAIADECRLNCRMARINEFLETLENKPEHVNFI